MKAFVTSIGESTTDLCVWSLKRQGFEVSLVKDPTTSLASKLDQIYFGVDQDFVRVDADVVVNKKLTPQFLNQLKEYDDFVWWWQFFTYDWFKQDTTHGGVQFIRLEAIPALRANVKQYLKAERPETQLYRLSEFSYPRRCASKQEIVGLNGYKQTDVKRVQETKVRRGQLENYDFELAKALEEL